MTTQATSTTLTLRAAARTRSHRHKLLAAALLAGCAALPALPTLAQDAPGIVGKNEWLYYKYELSSGDDQAGITTTVDLIRRINKVFQKNGVAVIVAMVPLKVRVHPENLPASVKLTDKLNGQYGRILASLQEGGVLTADLNTAFVKSPNRTSPMPLFFRLDTHWSAAGALLGAETIRDAINAQPSLKSILDTVPEAAYKLTWATQEPMKKGDLVGQLPKGAPSIADEPVKYFEVEKVPAAGGASLLGASNVAITLLGSSYTHEWTKFPGAVSYALQRDILSISVDASQGQWVGLHTYLRDDAFQTNRPKLLIWEMPERDMSAPPQYKWRDARYTMDNTEWLLQAAALVQQECPAGQAKAKLDATGLGAAQASPGVIAAQATGAQDFVDISFDKPVERLDFLSARIVTAGSKSITLEASGPGAPARKITLPAAGDDTEHALKTPLVAKTKGFTKVRLFPGKTTSFSLKDIQVCALPDELLK